MDTRFFFPFVPEIMVISDLGILNVFEKIPINSELAFPSTGGALRYTFISAFLIVIMLRDDFGETVMSIIALGVMIM